MAKFLFVLGVGLENPSKATRCMQFAKVAVREGHEVKVFLVDDGVVFAKQGMTDLVICPTGDDMKSYVNDLIAAKVPFLVCAPCASARDVNEKDFIPGARMDNAKTLIALAAESTVMTF